MKNMPSLLFFLALVVGGGLAIGLLTQPDGWYAALAKPSFNPPNWVFGPAWTTLYILIAIAGWRTWLRAPKGPAMRLWAAQLLLNFAWTPTFFAAHAIGTALAVLVALLVAILLFIYTVEREDRIAALLFAPYALWVAFAGMLNASLFLMN